MGKKCCGGGCHSQDKKPNYVVQEPTPEIMELVKSIAESGKKADGRR